MIRQSRRPLSPWISVKTHRGLTSSRTSRSWSSSRAIARRPISKTIWEWTMGKSPTLLLWSPRWWGSNHKTTVTWCHNRHSRTSESQICSLHWMVVPAQTPTLKTTKWTVATKIISILLWVPCKIWTTVITTIIPTATVPMLMARTTWICRTRFCSSCNNKFPVRSVATITTMVPTETVLSKITAAHRINFLLLWWARTT